MTVTSIWQPRSCSRRRNFFRREKILRALAESSLRRQMIRIRWPRREKLRSGEGRQRLSRASAALKKARSSCAGGVAHAAERGVFMNVGDAAAVAEGHVCEQPAVALFQGKIFVAADHSGADGGVVFAVDGTADVMKISRDFEQAQFAEGQVVKGKRDFEEGTDDRGDAFFVANIAQVGGNPRSEPRDGRSRCLAFRARSAH